MSPLRRTIVVDRIDTIGTDEPPPAADQQAYWLDVNSEASEGGYETSTSFASAMPWWPVNGEAVAEQCEAYHASTQLRNGRLSVIIDPGAWTNLVGKTLARQIAKRALDAGHTPTQQPM